MSDANPPAWHIDPFDSNRLRWWNGTEWTEHTEPQTTPEPIAETSVIGDQAGAHYESPHETFSPPGTAPEGLDAEREAWLKFAKSEYDEMVESFDRERAGLESEVAAIETQLIDLGERQEMQEVGLDDDGTHPVSTSVEFKDAVTTAKKRRKEMAKRKDAVLGSTSWTVNGSIKEGRQMVDQFSKLMLRSYNSELDSLIKATNATNSAAKMTALGKKRDQIRKLGASMNIEVHPEYHELASYEIQVTGLYQAAKLREKEADRAHKEQLREQKKVEAEIKREQEKLDKEAELHRQALATIENDPDADPNQLAELRAKVAEVEAAQADVMKREANTRAGHVYVISNQGSFGEDMVKIGMTRRLEPLDRVRELGDASVPFRFSVHALLFSDDAVGLEAELHRRFAAVRVNRINHRREFFRTTPEAVRDALVDLNAHIVEFDPNPIDEEWAASQ